MHHLRYFLRKYWPILILVLVEAVLFATNFTPNTFVVGWDNLFPEFNFGLNIKRSLFAVWQEYRGLGLEDGLSHAANLPHHLLLFVLSFVFQTELLRYLFIFLTHLLGGIGVYFLISDVLSGKSRYIKSISVFAALFYQLNFATVQMYYLPFEPFMAHFAALPWLMWSVRRYFLQGDKRSLLWYAVISLLSTPQAHVPTVFLVYLTILGIFSLVSLATHGRKILRRILVITLVTFYMNAFWALPFAHSALTNAKTIAQSKNNQMATDDIFLKNHEYGDLQNTALMRSFSLDYIQYDPVAEKPDLMFTPWLGHIKSLPAMIIGWVFFGLVLFGSVIAVSKKQKNLYPFVALFVFTFLIIGNDIPILGIFSYALRTYIPLFHNVFRFVFTKFFTLYAFLFSIFIAVALSYLLDFTRTYLKKVTLPVVGLVFSVMLAFVTYPAFTGNFVYKHLRVAIPQEYFELFEFFNRQPANERVALFPMPWFWAWTSYRWGTINSGFTWFGLEQPTMDRAFDPWSNHNENFYWEASQALYATDTEQFETMLQKYHIKWLVIDKNSINVGYYRALYLDQLEEIIRSSQVVNQVFSSGNTTVYAVRLSESPTNFVSVTENAPNIGPESQWNDFDTASLKNSVYISAQEKSYDEYFPFRSLFSGRAQTDLEYDVDDSGENIIFQALLPSGLQNATLSIPAFDPQDLIDVDANRLDNPVFIQPSVWLDGLLLSDLKEQTDTHETTITIPNYDQGFLEVRLPKIYGYYSYDSLPWDDFAQTPKSCDSYNTDLFIHELLIEDGKQKLRLTSQDSSNCINFDLGFLPQRLSYLVTLETKHVEGKSLFFSVVDSETRRSFLETNLETTFGQIKRSHLVIPPREFSGLGYNLSFDNVSIGREKTVNELRRITVHQIPYKLLTSMKVIRNPVQTDLQNQTEVQVSHPNPALYRLEISSQKEDANLTVVLSQAFHPGWLAFEKTHQFPYFTQLGDHVLVNNWANGWNVDQAGTFYIVFWPQLLELGGLLLIPLPFLWLLFLQKRTSL